MKHDDQWLRALAGQATDQADSPDPATALEARLLRQALTAGVHPAADLSEAQANQLLSAALAGAAPKRAGTRTFCDGCVRRWRAFLTLGAGQWVPASGLAGALGLLALVLIINPLANEPDEAGILRSAGPAGLQSITDPQPLARRDQLALALTGWGADVQRYERLGRYGIDAQFELPLAPAAAAGLKRLGLKPDSAGVVKVEVVQADR
jgi:hypothetical protein